ncbi:HeH/LEM domain-containing protein [Alloiococcus otitis]
MPQLKEILDDRGVDYPANARKDNLIDLAQGSED